MRKRGGRTEHLRGSAAEVVVVLIVIVNLSSTGSAAAAVQGAAAQQRQHKALAAAAQRRSAVVTSQGSGNAARQCNALAAAAWQLQRSGGSTGLWQLQRSRRAQCFLRRSAAAQGVGSCSAALERSGVFAGQRRAAAAQLGSAGLWLRQRGSCSTAVERCVVFAGQRQHSSASYTTPRSIFMALAVGGIVHGSVNMRPRAERERTAHRQKKEP